MALCGTMHFEDTRSFVRIEDTMERYHIQCLFRCNLHGVGLGMDEDVLHSERHALKRHVDLEAATVLSHHCLRGLIQEEIMAMRSPTNYSRYHEVLREWDCIHSMDLQQRASLADHSIRIEQMLLYCTVSSPLSPFHEMMTPPVRSLGMSIDLAFLLFSLSRH